MSKSKSIITLQELYQRYEQSREPASARQETNGSTRLLLGQALSLPENEQLQFFLPDLAQWGTFVSSLLKFAFPPSQVSHTYRRFVIQWLANARVNKRHIHKLSWPALEWLLQQLCLESLSAHCGNSVVLTAEDAALQLWLASLDVSEFQVKRLVEGDIHLFAQEDPSRLHSYYYQGQVDQETLTRLLSAYGFSQTSTGAAISWLEGCPDETALVLAYWLVRRLAYPLPWASLLQTFRKSAPLWLTLTENQPLLGAMARQSERIQKNGTALKSVDFTFDEASAVMAAYQRDNLNAAEFMPNAERPYHRVILVEGTTEAILLPLLAELYCRSKYGSDKRSPEFVRQFSKIAQTLVLPVGGKNQMLSMYRALAHDLAVPIAILLDQDAASTQEQLASLKRPQDPVVMIAQGEMEDLYSVEMLLPIINNAYHPHPVLTSEVYQSVIQLEHPLLSSFHGVQRPSGRVAELRLIWQVFAFGRFDKVEMAQLIAAFLSEFIEKEKKLSPESVGHILSPVLSAYLRELYELP